jgi:hypothetical protein
MPKASRRALEGRRTLAPGREAFAERARGTARHPVIFFQPRRGAVPAGARWTWGDTSGGLRRPANVPRLSGTYAEGTRHIGSGGSGGALLDRVEAIW